MKPKTATAHLRTQLLQQRDLLLGRHYNATISTLMPIHENLLVMRVVPDHGVPNFLPGQFTVLGLGSWEPDRRDGGPYPGDRNESTRLIKRPYSISCSLIDAEGQLITTGDSAYLEFLIALIQQPASVTAGLTPRLFALQAGARLFCGPRPTGHYTLPPFRGTETVVFAATGTGEAPHNAMVADLLVRQFAGPIVVVTCVRHRRDLAYEKVHRELESRFSNYHYLPLTTREPENLEPSTPGYIGKRYMQDYFTSGDLERDSQIRLHPANCHVFLCGNPAMIGRSLHAAGSDAVTQPLGMLAALEQLGFTAHRRDEPGNIHLERYW